MAVALSCVCHFGIWSFCRQPRRTFVHHIEVHTLKPYHFFQTILFCLFCGHLIAQQDSTRRDSAHILFSIPVQATFVTADHLSNTYLVKADNSVEKYDSTGRRVARYSNNRLGGVAFADVTNPLKILLWYADFQTIVTLDRTLNEIGQLNLNDVNLPTVKSIGQAQDGNIWIYDDAGFRLMKITPAGEVVLESQPLNLVFPDRLTATCIRDNGEMVFVSDPQQGISAFDQYGYLLRTYPDLKATVFEVLREWLVIPEKNTLRYEHLSRFQTLRIALPVNGGRFWTGNNRVFIQSEQGVQVFGINKA